MSLRDQLQAVYEQHGKLTPALLVDAARPKTSPLHDRFVWDNRVAGEKYREIQAAELIRSVKIVWIDGDEPSDVRAWHATREEHEFKPIEEILDDDIAKTVLLKQAEREWRAMHRRYKHLKEFLDIVREAVA